MGHVYHKVHASLKLLCLPKPETKNVCTLFNTKVKADHWFTLKWCIEKNMRLTKYCSVAGSRMVSGKDFCYSLTVESLCTV